MTISRKQKQLYFFFMQHKRVLQPYSLPPGKQLPDDQKLALQNANKEYSKTRNFTKYTERIQSLFGLPDFVPLTEREKFYFGGFLEGEGSICVGAKKSSSPKFGVYFDPEFNLTQHVNGSIHLFRCLCHFRTGFIRYKSKSNATLVYTIQNRQTLKEKILPFYKDYVLPSSSFAKQQRFEKWCTLLTLFDQGAHEDLQRFLYEIGPIWDELRMQKAQSNESFRSLEDFQKYVLAWVKEKS